MKTLVRQAGRTLTLLRAALVLAVGSAALTATSPALASVQANPHGAVSAMNGASLSKLPSSQWGPHLSAMHQSGVQMVRSDAAWSDIEPQAPTSSGPGWQWTKYDAWVAALASHHLTWQPIIDYDTSWANAITDNADFATFAAAVAARYGAGGSFWIQNPKLPYLPARIFEIWNEENVTWAYHIEPVAYGPLYMAARTAIDAIDPSASVDVGGLADYGAYEADHDYPGWYLVYLFGDYPQLETSVDGIAVHPYGPSATDTEEWVSHLRYVMNVYHVPTSVPIDVTEFGWQYQASSESWRATQMNAVGGVFSRSNCGIREAAPYDWINPTSVGDTTDFGFVAPSGTSTALRQAGVAWFNAFAQGGAQPTYVMC